MFSLILLFAVKKYNTSREAIVVQWTEEYNTVSRKLTEK